MLFKRLSQYFSELEATSLRNKMTEILSRLFKEAEAKEIDKLCYLLQGRVAPLFTAIEFGLADKTMIKAISIGMGIDQDKVLAEFKRVGDLGLAVENIKLAEKGKRKAESRLNILHVYKVLYKVATSGGTGSQDIKINLLGDLLRDVDPLSARYIVRITLAKLRLGFSDMTILDSLAWMLTGTKELRARIEKAYDVRPDLGFIAKTIKEKGIKGLSKVTPVVGTPILMAKAERLTTPDEIIEKIGECSIEPKIDGFRLQIHFQKAKDKVELFTRNLENVTFMYPDITSGVRKEIKVREAIFEGEAIAFNPKTGQYLPFQETVQRKRKYDIEEMSIKVPLKLIAFDLLYLNGESLIERPYKERRKKLVEII